MKINQVVSLTRVSPRLINMLMINYFYKVTNFAINQTQLYNEWFTVANKHDLFKRTQEFIPSKKSHFFPFYYRMLINYPDSFNENLDPVWVHKNPLNQGIGQPNWSVNNIIKDWKNTYTENVVRIVNDYIMQKNVNYKIQTIKYTVLGPYSKISPHTDNDPKPRFFLSVSAPIGCYMEIYGIRHSMSEVGALYRLNSRCIHSPVNESNEYRVMMTFDYLK